MPVTDKSFLVLFFKKELLAFLSFQMVTLPEQLQKKKQKTFDYAEPVGG